ncbi:hypothetical protein G9A89_023476 [Geosiphon pyriformis]|nr:hypothetical protein G9A89_023476 [Geosiphon pyriformis]
MSPNLRYDLVYKAVEEAHIENPGETNEQYEIRLRHINRNIFLTEQEKSCAKAVFTKSKDQENLLNRTGQTYKCNLCGRAGYTVEFCENCARDCLEKDFPYWSSGDEIIDTMIRDSQLNLPLPGFLIEWIEYKDLRNISFKTKGSCSSIYTATWRKGCLESFDNVGKRFKRSRPKRVVLKVLKSSKFTNQHFLNELTTHINLRAHGYQVVHYYGVSKAPVTDEYIIVMKEMDQDLRSFLNNGAGSLTWTTVFKLFSCLALTLNNIHKENIIHRDLHSGNILVGQSDYWFISDLGFFGPPNKPTTSIYGNLPYMAPEIICGNPYTPEADIYSMGILMYEVTCSTPFGNRPHNFELAMDIVLGIRPTILTNIPEDYEALMKRCWDADPSKRPTAKYLRKWFYIHYQIRSKESILIFESECKREPISMTSKSAIYQFNELPIPRNATYEEQQEYDSRIQNLALSEEAESHEKSEQDDSQNEEMEDTQSESRTEYSKSPNLQGDFDNKIFEFPTSILIAPHRKLASRSESQSRRSSITDISTTVTFRPSIPRPKTVNVVTPDRINNKLKSEKMSKLRFQDLLNPSAKLKIGLMKKPKFGKKDFSSGDKLVDELLKNPIYIPPNIHDKYDIGRVNYYEWIPWERLSDIKKIGEGGFGIIYKATYIEGLIDMWIKPHGSMEDKRSKYDLNIHRTVFIENYGHTVLLTQIRGITQNIKTLEYGIVMVFSEHGDTRKYSSTNFHSTSWFYKLWIAWGIAYELNDIHKAGMIHRDLHSGSILQHKNSKTTRATEEKKIFGVIPYIPPEVLRGEKFTTAGDVYSFAMLLWELATGKPPFYDYSHDAILIMAILNGARPEINSPLIPLSIAEIIEKCWDNNPDNRPATREVERKLWELKDKYKNRFKRWIYFGKSNKLLRKLVENDEITIHPGAIYTSRLLTAQMVNFSTALWVFALQDNKCLEVKFTISVLINSNYDITKRISFSLQGAVRHSGRRLHSHRVVMGYRREAKRKVLPCIYKDVLACLSLSYFLQKNDLDESQAYPIKKRGALIIVEKETGEFNFLNKHNLTRPLKVVFRSGRVKPEFESDPIRPNPIIKFAHLTRVGNLKKIIRPDLFGTLRQKRQKFDFALHFYADKTKYIKQIEDSRSVLMFKYFDDINEAPSSDFREMNHNLRDHINLSIEKFSFYYANLRRSVINSANCIASLETFSSIWSVWIKSLRLIDEYDTIINDYLDPAFKDPYKNERVFMTGEFMDLMYYTTINALNNTSLFNMHLERGVATRLMISNFDSTLPLYHDSRTYALTQIFAENEFMINEEQHHTLTRFARITAGSNIGVCGIIEFIASACLDCLQRRLDVEKERAKVYLETSWLKIARQWGWIGRVRPVKIGWDTLSMCTRITQR